MLELRNIESGYNKKAVLRGVSLDIAAGQIVALIGPNGSGKSTVLKTAMGVIKAKRGDILYKGSKINGNSPGDNIKKGMVYVPQGNVVFRDLTVIENLRMGGYALPDRSTVRDRIRDIFRLFPEIEERKCMDAGHLSGGEQQMLALGRALMLKPELFLLDEPSLGLSPGIAKKIFETIRNICAQFDASALIAEQNVKRVLEIADMVYALRLGEVVMKDDPASLTDARIKEAFLGK